MPLSEHEQRLLEQMERALYAEDPKFASTLRGHDLRGRYRRRAVVGILGVIVGLALLPVGVAGRAVGISVVGFLVMLGSAIFAVSSWRRAPAAADSTGAPAPTGGRRSGRAKAPKPPKATFMDRLEERWRRRREDGGR